VCGILIAAHIVDSIQYIMNSELPVAVAVSKGGIPIGPPMPSGLLPRKWGRKLHPWWRR